MLLDGVQGSQGTGAPPLKGEVATSVIWTKSHWTSASILALLDRRGRLTASSMLTLRSRRDRFRFICFHSFASAWVTGSVCSSGGGSLTDRERGDVWIPASDRMERRERFLSDSMGSWNGDVGMGRDFLGGTRKDESVLFSTSSLFVTCVSSLSLLVFTFSSFMKFFSARSTYHSLSGRPKVDPEKEACSFST